MMTKTLRRRVLSITVGAALAIGVACATHNIQQSQQTGRFEIQPGGFNQFSPEQEVQVGQQAEAEASRQLPMLPESDPVTQYVKQLGQKLAAKAPGPKWPFRFHVVNQKEINAFALPGGPVFINVGTIQKAGDEGELAGVMAHEISHVVLRHGTQQASKASLAQLPLAVLGGVLPQGVGGQLARLGISFGAQSIFLKYSRDAEREADLLGAQIMYDAGYNPYDMVEFFTILEKEGGPGAPQFLSDHPNPGNRAQTVSQAVAKFPRKSYQKDSPQFERAKTDAQRLKPLSAQEIAQRQQQQDGAGIQNISLQEILPSGQFRELNHNAFRIAYPANWEAFGNQNSTVAVAPRSAVGDNAIAVGTIVSGYRPSSGGSLQQGTAELVDRLRSANPEMRVTGNPQQLSINGLPAMSVALRGVSPLSSQGQALAERDQLVTVQRPDGALLFLVFVAPDDMFARLQPAYEQMLQSLQVAR